VLNVTGPKHSLCAGFSKTLSVHQAVNGYPTLSVHPAVNGYLTLSVHQAVNGYLALSVHQAVNGYPTLSVHQAVNGYLTLSVHQAVNGYLTLSVHQAVNGYLALSVHPAEYWTLLRAGEGEGNEEEEWSPTSVTSLVVQIGNLDWLREQVFSYLRSLGVKMAGRTRGEKGVTYIPLVCQESMPEP